MMIIVETTTFGFADMVAVSLGLSFRELSFSEEESLLDMLFTGEPGVYKNILTRIIQESERKNRPYHQLANLLPADTVFLIDAESAGTEAGGPSLCHMSYIAGSLGLQMAELTQSNRDTILADLKRSLNSKQSD